MAFPSGEIPPQSLSQYSTWEVYKYPESNPASIGGFDMGLWKCLVILACITVAFRLFSLGCLKLLVNRFQ